MLVGLRASSKPSRPCLDFNDDAPSLLGSPCVSIRSAVLKSASAVSRHAAASEDAAKT